MHPQCCSTWIVQGCVPCLSLDCCKLVLMANWYVLSREFLLSTLILFHHIWPQFAYIQSLFGECIWSFAQSLSLSLFHWPHMLETALKWLLNTTVKIKKIWTSENFCCNHPKIWTTRLYHRVMLLKDADGIANSVNPDQEQSDLGLLYLPRPVCPKTLW